MFTPKLYDSSSRYAKLEGRQKWVTFTQLELRKLMSERALGKNSGLHGTQALLLTLFKANLRRNVGQVILSGLGSQRNRLKSRIQELIVYLGGRPRKHQSGSGRSETGRHL